MESKIIKHKNREIEVTKTIELSLIKGLVNDDFMNNKHTEKYIYNKCCN